MPKILFASGGTGGHLFPAQALARDLQKKNSAVQILFAGAHLSTNHYFNRNEFAFHEIPSMSPFRKGIKQTLQTAATLFHGIYQSVRLLRTQKPELMIGFGSYHSFPLLCAALLTRTPLVLFESNAIPGKVIRLFSSFARFTAIYLPVCKQHLKGVTCEVEIPSQTLQVPQNAQEARRQLNLHPDRLTLLVFGGSQGAKAMNRSVLELLPSLKEKGVQLQLIHLTGSEEAAQQMQKLCCELGIDAYVKKFEAQMHTLWSAADLAICRAGAATLSELIHYEVPAVLIPYPHAADQHQLKNAQFLEKSIGGAKVIEEAHLSLEALESSLLGMNPEEIARQKRAIFQYKSQQRKADLASLILSTRFK